MWYKWGSMHQAPYLSAKNRENKLAFLVGSDVLGGMAKWFRISDILSMADICYIERPGTQFDVSRLVALGASLIPIQGTTPSCSSREIRSAIRCRKTITEYCPASVADYIKQNELYQ